MGILLTLLFVVLPIVAIIVFIVNLIRFLLALKDPERLSSLYSPLIISAIVAIGVAAPVSVLVDTFGTGTAADDVIADAVSRTFDLTPAGIIRSLRLRRPIYKALAAYGHMGRTDTDAPWEATDKAAELRAFAGR
jgi:S-adenosylmethionine synthetase